MVLHTKNSIDMDNLLENNDNYNSKVKIILITVILISVKTIKPKIF